MTYILLADGFEEIEALCPLDLLLRAGIEAKTVSIGKSRLVTGTHGIRTEADMLMSEIPSDVLPEMIVLPGGMPGASNLDNSDAVKNMVKEAYLRGAYVAAICAAPFILGKMGILKGKKAICYPGFEDALEGAEISQDKVVRDKNVITAAGMGVAIEFGYELILALKGKETADTVMKRILWG